MTLSLRAFVLLALALTLLGGCAALQPSHTGRFDFQGTVTDASGSPVPGAWVKVRGWETRTDREGRWKQERILGCGALRESMSGEKEDDVILITAPGFESAEHHFVVEHPQWFSSCEKDRSLRFETKLVSLAAAPAAVSTAPTNKKKPVAPPATTPRTSGKYEL